MAWFLFVLVSLLLVGSVWLNIVTIRKNLELNDQREALVDTIEESLDVLDTCYSRISHAAEIPVYSDEPIIRELVADIRHAKHAVLAIASNVVIYGEEKDATSE